MPVYKFKSFHRHRHHPSFVNNSFFVRLQQYRYIVSQDKRIRLRCPLRFRRLHHLRAHLILHLVLVVCLCPGLYPLLPVTRSSTRPGLGPLLLRDRFSLAGPRPPQLLAPSAAWAARRQSRRLDSSRRRPPRLRAAPRSDLVLLPLHLQYRLLTAHPGSNKRWWRRSRTSRPRSAALRCPSWALRSGYRNSRHQLLPPRGPRRQCRLRLAAMILGEALRPRSAKCSGRWHLN